MRRLTLRDRTDARFLARIVERDGFVFVLDFGDADWIADATDRVHRGVTLDGRHIGSGTEEFLEVLADSYEREGLDAEVEAPRTTHMEFVFQEEPTLEGAALVEPGEEDEETELVPLEMRQRALGEHEQTEVHVGIASLLAEVGDLGER